jgi:hypothetical protein
MTNTNEFRTEGIIAKFRTRSKDTLVDVTVVDHDQQLVKQTESNDRLTGEYIDFRFYWNPKFKPRHFSQESQPLKLPR